MVPALHHKNAPVPIVSFAWPASRQRWPNSEACWSPTLAPIIARPPQTDASVTAIWPAVGATAGSICAGMPNRPSIAASQVPAARLNSIVRDAIDGSVTCTAPPVSRQVSQQQTSPSEQIAALRGRSGPGHLVEQPAQLGRGERGLQRQPGRRPDLRLVAGLAQLLAPASGPGIPPADRGEDRLAGAARPRRRRSRSAPSARCPPRRASPRRPDRAPRAGSRARLRRSHQRRARPVLARETRSRAACWPWRPARVVRRTPRTGWTNCPGRQPGRRAHRWHVLTCAPLRAISGRRVPAPA